MSGEREPFRSVLQPRELMNLAGFLTLLRFPLAIITPFFKHDPAAMLAILIAAGISDLLDGVVARRTGTVSRSGALIDGFVDKIFLVNFAWSLALAEHIDGWHMALWFVREMIQGAMLPFMSGRYVSGDAPWPTHAWQGKIVSAAVGIGMFAALLGPRWALDGSAAVAGAFGLWVGIRYLLRDRPWDRSGG